MPHKDKCINREAMKLYKEELGVEQIMMFEYLSDIAFFSQNGMFKIKKSTLASNLRLNRRKIDSLLKWMIDISVLKEVTKDKNQIRTFYFDYHHLQKNPEVVFSNGIPSLPQYKGLSEKSIRNRRLQLFKNKRK